MSLVYGVKYWAHGRSLWESSLNVYGDRKLILGFDLSVTVCQKLIDPSDDLVEKLSAYNLYW